MRRLTMMLTLTVATSVGLTSGARGDILNLSPEAASVCSACATPAGGAQVVNLLATLAPQDLPLDPPDQASPPAEGYAAAAERMAADAESLDQNLATGDGAAADDVELGIVGGLADSGAIRVGAALCVEAGIYCPVVVAGTAMVFYIAGHSLLSVASTAAM